MSEPKVPEAFLEWWLLNEGVTRADEYRGGPVPKNRAYWTMNEVRRKWDGGHGVPWRAAIDAVLAAIEDEGTYGDCMTGCKEMYVERLEKLRGEP